MGLATDQIQEAHSDLSGNRLHQLSGSIWLREREIIRRIIGEEAYAQGVIEEEAIATPTPQEKNAYAQGLSLATDALDYGSVKFLVEQTVRTGLIGLQTFAFRSEGFMAYERIATGMKIHTIKFLPGEVTREIELFYTSDAAEPTQEDADNAILTAYESELSPPQPEALSAINLTAFRSGLSEANRRLDKLAQLGDLPLRSAVLNGAGLETIFPTQLDVSAEDEYRSWE